MTALVQRELQAWRAALRLRFEARGPATVLAMREHDGPLVVQKALYPEAPQVCHAIVVHPPAGIAGGDALSIDVALEAGAHALVTTPGAAKWYRSNGRPASQEATFRVAAGASLEWLPQESIVFDGAVSRQSWRAELAGDARLVAWDIQCLGRTGSGETFGHGELRLEARIARDGRLAWIERGCIRAPMRALHSPAGLAAQPVFGTLAVAAPVIEDAWISQARAHQPREGEGAVTRLPGVLLVRYRGDASEAAREYFHAVWSSLRPAVLGRPAIVPRIWRT